jgi:hypothetical protein
MVGVRAFPACVNAPEAGRWRFNIPLNWAVLGKYRQLGRLCSKNRTFDANITEIEIMDATPWIGL